MNSPFLSRLNTNYAPTEPEIAQIRDYVKENRAALLDIDKAIETLTRHRDSRKSIIDQHEALLSPIRRVPEDILSSIFSQVVNGAKEPAALSRSHPAVFISHASRHWRRLALATPSLWNTIVITTPPTPNGIGGQRAGPNINIAQDRARRWVNWINQVIKMTKEWIVRAGSSPLSLKVEMDIKGRDGGSGDATSTALTELITALCSACQRWGKVNLKITTTRRGVVAPLLSLTARDVPQLTKLDYSVFFMLDNNPNDKKVALWKENILKARSLRSLVISFETPSYTSLGVNWAGLTQLKAGNDEGFEFSSYDALQLLGLCPNLEACDLRLRRPQKYSRRYSSRPLPVIAPEDYPVIVLPRLMALTLRGWSPEEAFRTSLHLPSLRSFRLIEGDAPASKEHHRDVLAWLQQFGAQLSNVRLEINLYTLSEMALLLRCIPNVASLRIHAMYDRFSTYEGNGELYTHLIPLLTPNPDEGYDRVLCPSLTHFTCHFDRVSCTEKDLVNFVAARRRKGGDVALIKEVTVDLGNTVQSLDIREALRGRNVDLGDLKLGISYAKPSSYALTEAFAKKGCSLFPVVITLISSAPPSIDDEDIVV
ncbi:hypothetical protein DFP72DRAFT_1173632 [Ephemerocybe angulata]|uniref:F-box domain-containing protein n=1 Tax=Ephemerocybe angulata TaxID=980116 RepID=A0A8H6M004_9AGAR|nr:hypothetical protein DFP72DRAFT_1173632 [Tulosesus angulatus]